MSLEIVRLRVRVRVAVGVCCLRLIGVRIGVRGSIRGSNMVRVRGRG